MGVVAAIRQALIGRAERLPSALVRVYPELERVRMRRGGLPPRIGGWALGRGTVAAITLRQWVFVAPKVAVSAELLLHELRHVEQFETSRLFPLRYLWATVRHGYLHNPYEADARDYAARRLRDQHTRFVGER